MSRRPGARPPCGWLHPGRGCRPGRSTSTSSSTGTAWCCSTPGRTGRRSPILDISLAACQECCTAGLAQFDIRAGQTLRLGSAACATRSGMSASPSSSTCAGPYRRTRRVAGRGHRRRRPEWSTLSSLLPELRGLMRRHIDLPGLRWRRITPEPTDDPALAPFRSGHTTSSVMAASWCCRHPGARRLRSRCWCAGLTLPPLLLVGDLSYDAQLLEAGRVPGVGNRRQLREVTAMVNQLSRHQPGLAVLPAHDPGAADRLARRPARRRALASA